MIENIWHRHKSLNGKTKRTLGSKTECVTTSTTKRSEPRTRPNLTHTHKTFSSKWIISALSLWCSTEKLQTWSQVFFKAFGRYRGTPSLRPYDHKHHRLSRPVELKTNVRKPSQLRPDEAVWTVCLYTHSKVLSAGFTDGLLKWCGCVLPPERLLLTVRAESCLSVLLCFFFFFFSIFFFFVAPLKAPMEKKKKKYHSVIRSLTQPIPCVLIAT